MSSDEIKQRHEEWVQQQQSLNSIDCTTLEEYHQVLSKWLYLESEDTDFIDVALAALLDREISGDPVWLYLIAPPGGVKSELLRCFRCYDKGYTLDTLTPATFVSGLAEKNKDTGEREPVAGILQDLNGKTVIVKDFTTILNSSEETKTEIYGQLRSIYDGYYEKAFGTMRMKVSIEAVIGLLVGVTPVIDKYTRMQSALGERFLKIRNNPDRWKAAERALSNEGKEHQMREELNRATESYLKSLSFETIPTITDEQAQDILRMGMYVGFMRANVWESYESGRIIDMELMGSEVPTRLAKQFKHLVKLLAIVRGRTEVTEDDMRTLSRVARDTAEAKKQAIIDHYVEHGGRTLEMCFDPSDIAGHIQGLYRTNTRNHLDVLLVLDCMYQTDQGLYGFTDKFKEYVKAVYRIPSPPVSLQNNPENSPFSPENRGILYGKSQLQDKLDEVEAIFRELGQEIKFSDFYEAYRELLGFKDEAEAKKILDILEKRERVLYQPRPGIWRLA